MDLVGPLQVVTALTLGGTQFRPVVVGKTLDPVATDGPLQLVPDRTFTEVPDPFALVVPGGPAAALRAMADDSLLDYIRTASRTAEVVRSVCTGALLLAVAGVLEGRRATTHWSFSKQLERLAARYTAERWVEDGPVITCAGITAGIDMALHLVDLVDRLAGRRPPGPP